MNTLTISEENFKSIFAGLRKLNSPDELQNSEAFAHLIDVADRTFAKIEETTQKFRKDIVNNIKHMIPDQILQTISTDKLEFCENEVFMKLKKLNQNPNAPIIEMELQNTLKQLTDAKYQVEKYLKTVAEALDSENTNLSKTFENALQRSWNIINLEVSFFSSTSMLSTLFLDRKSRIKYAVECATW